MATCKPLDWFSNFYIINSSLKKDDLEPHISRISGSLVKHPARICTTSGRFTHDLQMAVGLI